jgi:integral membrane protein
VTGDDERTSVTTEPTSTPTDDGAAAATHAAWARKARGSLRRYRVMAWVTGAMLLLLCVEMVLKYVLQLPGFTVEGDPRSEAARIIAMVHGWVYVVYLVTVFDLWSTLRWKLGRLVTMALAGVVPVMSFVLERRVHADATARVEQVVAASARA